MHVLRMISTPLAKDFRKESHINRCEKQGFNLSSCKGSETVVKVFDLLMFPLCLSLYVLDIGSWLGDTVCSRFAFVAYTAVHMCSSKSPGSLEQMRRVFVRAKGRLESFFIQSTV